MTPALKKLFKTFYLPPDTAKYENEIEVAHQQFREHLSKEDRILVLSIMDNQVLAWDAKVKRAFVCGFHLALRLSDELNMYEHEHLLSRQRIEDARFDYTDKEKTP